MATKVTRDVLEGYLHCKPKAHLKLACKQGRVSGWARLGPVASTASCGERMVNDWVPADWKKRIKLSAEIARFHDILNIEG
jgi:hypothetical protein